MLGGYRRKGCGRARHCACALRGTQGAGRAKLKRKPARRPGTGAPGRDEATGDPVTKATWLPIYLVALKDANLSIYALFPSTPCTVVPPRPPSFLMPFPNSSQALAPRLGTRLCSAL